jgi:MarR family transcriptional regulator, organic hydroperoxide resistance regulator
MPLPPDDRNHLFDLEGVDPRAANVFGEFRRAMRLHRQLMLRALAERETPPGQAMCLRMMATHDGSTQREIGDLLHLTAPTVTAMLKRMERGGTVVREPDPTDQRVTRVRLTPAGQELERELRAVLAARIGRLLDTMPAADRDDLARLLGDLGDRMAAALEDTTLGASAGIEAHAAGGSYR